MAWVAADEYGIEIISQKRPERNNGLWEDYCEVVLPKGAIKKLIGRDLDWNDEPVELKEE